MPAERVNRVSITILILLAVFALIAVLSGYAAPPQPDEGTAAHLFQVSIALLLPTLALFLATADWRHPVRSARPLVLPVAIVALAFGALFHLEHYR